MILVDTSVWIDYFRGVSTADTESLDTILADRMPFAITGVIYQEILQGADSPSSYQDLADHFGSQRFLHPSDPIETHAKAAQIYGRCRRAGITIRSTIDCLIAQIAIEHDAILLRSDRDYTQMATVIPELRLT
ncbi:MAG: PIN domain nuclease [Gammaproteobacteria bacterium]|nr:PIN domain nuclease [Gammaproteobacteria bacterium]